VKKIFWLITVFSCPELDNSQNNSKKIQKIRKHHPGFMLSRNGSRQAEKEREKFSHSEPILPAPIERISKIIAKELKEKIILSSFQAQSGRERPKKRNFFSHLEILLPDLT